MEYRERDPKNTTDPSAPAFPVIEGDPFPLGILAFVLMLPGATDEQRDKVVEAVTRDMDTYHRRLGGAGLEIVRRGYHQHAPGRYEWIMSPRPAPGWTADEEAQRMALVVLRLRAIENQMQFGR